MVQGHNGLDESGNTCRTFCMADLRFNGTQGTPLPVLTVCLIEDHTKPFKFRYIARYGTGPMRLYQFNGSRAVTRHLITSPHRLGLPLREWGINTRTSAVRRSPNPLYYCINTVSFAFCIFQSLEGNHPQTLTQHHSVRLIRKGTTVIRAREGRCLAETGVQERTIRGIDSARNHQV